jgi:hypothetical protein
MLEVGWLDGWMVDEMEKQPASSKLHGFMVDGGKGV